MPSIVKKGTNKSAFKLISGKKYVLYPGVITVLTDDEYNALMKEYGKFIMPRIISDKNPRGCFIVNDSKAKAEDMNKEIGDEIKDNSAPIEVDMRKKSKKGKK